MAPASSTEPPRGAPLILCAGIAVIDYIFGVGAIPKRDSKNKATSFTVSSGGNMANAAIAIANSADAPACRRRSAARPAPTLPATPS